MAERERYKGSKAEGLLKTEKKEIGTYIYRCEAVSLQNKRKNSQRATNTKWRPFPLCFI